jgi:hypothetical protein
MNWLTGGAQGEAKRLISQLSDSTKREHAAQDLVKLGAEAVPTLIEALQARDPTLPPLIRQVSSRHPRASMRDTWSNQGPRGPTCAQGSRAK